MWLAMAALLLVPGDPVLGNGCADPPGPVKEKKVQEPYVEFDLSPLPEGPGILSLSIKVETTDPDISFETKIQRQIPTGGMPAPVGQTNMGTCEHLVDSMKQMKFRAEVVNQTKIRVYGRPFNDTFLPATRGTVTSPDLKKDELPKVKNPPKA